MEVRVSKNSVPFVCLNQKADCRFSLEASSLGSGTSPSAGLPSFSMGFLPVEELQKWAGSCTAGSAAGYMVRERLSVHTSSEILHS